MAQLKTKETVDRFYGLNLTGETQLKKGESPNMVNCYITDNYDLDKMYGYKQMMKTIGAAKVIRGMWQGIIAGEQQFLVACDGHVYKVTNGYWDDDTTWESTAAFTTHTTDLGTLTDATTRFFDFGGNVYILNGTEYKKWTGTGSITDVVGYTPKIRIGCKPLTAVGTDYEGVNQLVGQKRITYNADATAVYQVPETSIASVDIVKVNGVTKTVTTDYTVNTTTGRVTFQTGKIPTAGLDNVEIYWTKANNDRNVVVKNRAFVEFKNRMFLYGSSTASNMIIWSGLADGVPSAEYFPALAFQPVGSTNTGVIDVINGYDRLIVTKPRRAYFMLYDVHMSDSIDVVNFPLSDLNDAVGSQAFAQGQVIENYPITLENGIQEWVRTDEKDEKNAKDISLRIKLELNQLDLSTALTVDFRERNEYWIVINKTLYIYNYGLYGYENGKLVKGIYSKVVLEDTPTCITNINGEIYFGTDTGLIMKFSPDFLTFNGVAIEEHWESSFMDFGANYLTKTLDKVYVGLQPQLKSQATINYISNIETGRLPVSIKYHRQIFQLGSVNFGDFSFALSTNPQPKRVRLKAKKWTYLKITIDNISATETCKILNFTINIVYGGESK